MNRLRINSGSARGRKINMVPGDITRPISDRVKQALFNIIGVEIVAANFLDLFAGTGSVGIEALSRGAAHTRFIDRHKDAVSTIQKNLEATGLNSSSQVVQMDSFSLLAQIPNTAFDYVFIAPPQYKQLWEKALLALDSKPDWLVEDGWVIVQIHPKEYRQVALKEFIEFDHRKYGNTMLIFYERSELQEHE